MGTNRKNKNNKNISKEDLEVLIGLVGLGTSLIKWWLDYRKDKKLQEEKFQHEKFLKGMVFSIPLVLIVATGISVSYIFLLQAFNIVDWDTLQLVVIGIIFGLFLTGLGFIFLDETDKKQGDILIPSLKNTIGLFIFLGIGVPLAGWLVFKIVGLAFKISVWIFGFITAMFS